MSRRAKRPLNKAAVKKADAEFYAKHPELKGKPLSATDPKQAALRREWMDLYVKHGGKIEDAKGKSKTPIKSPVLTCPKNNPNAESKTKDNRIDIVFDPDKSKKVKKCNKIVHVQFNSRFADGKLIKPGDYYSGYKYKDKVATSKGWTVDCLKTETTPDYQQGVGNGKKNGGTVKAKISDAPQTGGGDNGFYDANTNPTGLKKYVIKFATFAYCMEGPDCGTWYEGITWEYTKTWKDQRDGNKGTSTITNNCVEQPSPDHIEAFDKFNKEKGFTPCK